MEFQSFMIARKINLHQVAGLFGLALELSWHNHLVIDEAQLSTTFGFPDAERKLYVFKTGSLVFQDFMSAEILMVQKFLEANVEEMEAKWASRYVESVRTEDLPRTEDDSREIYEGTVPFYLDRSMTLQMLTDQMNELLDCEEVLIERMRQEKSFLNLRYTSSARRKLILFQCKALNHATLLEDGIWIVDRKHKALCAALDEHLALSARTRDYQQKNAHLNTLLSRFSGEKFTTTMIRFFGYEVLLLITFPLSHLLPEKEGLIKALQKVVDFFGGLF